MAMFVIHLRRQKLSRFIKLDSGYNFLLSIFFPIILLSSPKSFAGFLNPSLKPIERCIPARTISGQELITKSFKPPFFIYFNGEGKTIDHSLLKANGLTGYISPYYPAEKSVEILNRQQLLLTGTVYIRDPSIFEKYLGGNRVNYLYEISYLDEVFLLDRRMLSKRS